MIKKGDFIELDYTAKIVDENIVFDTTEVDEATKAGILHDHEGHDDHGHGRTHNHLHKEDLKPITICVGERHVLPGLDAKIEGLTVGKHKILLNENEAFGKKDTKKLKLMPMSVFIQQKIRPYIGLTLDMDGTRGVVRSISGGRVIVDFNHPLSGKKIEYSITIKRVVDDKKEQLESVLKVLRFPTTSITVENNKGKVNTKLDLPKEIVDSLEKDLKRVTNIDVEIIGEKKEVKSQVKSEVSNVKSDVKSNEESDKTDNKLEEK